MSPIEHVWDDLNQSVPLLPISSNFAKPFEEEWDKIPQATINSLINSM
jgi:hypothetical protein